MEVNTHASGPVAEPARCLFGAHSCFCGPGMGNLAGGMCAAGGGGGKDPESVEKSTVEKQLVGASATSVVADVRVCLWGPATGRFQAPAYGRSHEPWV